MRRVLIGLIRAYRYLLSPWVGQHCRFYPSCSHYGEQAIRHHGAIKGSALALWRILRCNPWHPGGIDEVPNPEKANPATPQTTKPVLSGDQVNEC